MRNNKAYRITEFNDELLEILIKEYKENNMSFRKLQEKYNVNRHKLAKIFEEMNVKTTKGNHYRTYFHNFDYFEKIDSHEKSYWLGFIMADGYIQQYKGKYYGEDNLGITLHKRDSEILFKFKKAINSTNPVNFYNEKNQKEWVEKGYAATSDICKIIMKSQKTCDDLMRLGVVYKKSLIKRLPDKDKLPNKYFYSYLRGYLDGNGSIHQAKRVSNDNTLYISFSTCVSFAEDLQKIIGGKITKDKRCDKRVCSLTFNKKESKILLDKIYENSTEETRLERKYLKYLKQNNL